MGISRANVISISVVMVMLPTIYIITVPAAGDIISCFFCFEAVFVFSGVVLKAGKCFDRSKCNVL